MNVLGRPNKSTAFTLLELFVVLGTVCILLLLVMGAVVHGHTKWQRVACVNSLKNVGLAFRIFERDAGTSSMLPFQSSSNSPPLTTYDQFISRLRLMSNEISSPWVLVCTADSRHPATNWSKLSRTNISYFISLDAEETYPQSLLAGDRNVITNGVRIGPGIVKLGSSVTNAGWDRTIHHFLGNIMMADGSVQQLSPARFSDQMRYAGQNSMTLAVP